MKGKLLKRIAAIALSLLFISGRTPVQQFSGIFGDIAVAVSAEEQIVEIGTLEQWKDFADHVNSGTTYENQTVKLTTDIDGITMKVGTNSSSHEFKGTFDGCGHTLTMALTTDGSNFIAPFRCVNVATIKNLHTAGTISAGGRNSLRDSSATPMATSPSPTAGAA